MQHNKKLYFITALIIVIIVGVFWWKDKARQVHKNQATQQGNINNGVEWRCLKNTETVEHSIKEVGSIGAEVDVQIKENKKQTNGFKITDIRNNYHPFEFYSCGIYVIKLLNYDLNRLEQKNGSRAELWRYDYKNNGAKLILLTEKNDEGNYISYYGHDFRVSPTEQHVSLIKGYLGSNDYTVVIKDLETKQDVFEVSLEQISKKDQEFIGALDLKEWTQDGRYFWARTHMGAETKAFIRIDTQKWKYEILETPKVLMGGEALNVETGWTSYHPDAVWTGVYDEQEQIKAERREKGIGTQLYIYNLFSGEKIFVYETSEPLFFTQPKWISDTELEYNLPEGGIQKYQLK